MRLNGNQKISGFFEFAITSFLTTFEKFIFEVGAAILLDFIL